MDNNNKYYLFTVDYENNAETFWAGAGGAAWNFALWIQQGRGLADREGNALAFPAKEGFAFLDLLKSCPGWNDDNASACAPFPVCVEKDIPADKIKELLAAEALA